MSSIPVNKHRIPALSYLTWEAHLQGNITEVDRRGQSHDVTPNPAALTDPVTILLILKRELIGHSAVK